MVTSRFIYIFFSFLLVANINLYAQSNSKESVLLSEQRRFDAMIRRDTQALRQLLSDDLVYIHSNALKEDKLDHIHTIASGKIVYQNMIRETVNLRTYGKTAITSGTIKVKGLLQENPFELRMLYTAIYRKKKHTWQLVNWQSTRLP